MRTVHVNVQKAYIVQIGRGLLENLGERIRQVSSAGTIAVITDNNVDSLYGKKVMDSLETAGFFTCKYVFPAGEKSKNFDTLESILNFMAENGLKRNSLILALGGGVVGDVAGFAASVYMRGIDYIQVPTTLLAMVDSSVGGKTAVNLEKGKNMAGAFWQPLQVICDLNTLQTLSPEVFAEGMGEVIKTNWIARLNLHNALTAAGQNNEKRNTAAGQNNASSTAEFLPEPMEEIITACVEYKSKIVSADELDKKGIRTVLNAGHTVGHCIEKISDYAIAHGKAVATGLLWETAIACELGLCRIEILDGIKQEIKTYGLLETVNQESDTGEVLKITKQGAVASGMIFDSETWVKIMSGDKKNDSPEITFELITDNGKVVEKKLTGEETGKLLKLVYDHHLKN